MTGFVLASALVALILGLYVWVEVLHFRAGHDVYEWAGKISRYL